jgi:hypothetical protein
MTGCGRCVLAAAGACNHALRAIALGFDGALAQGDACGAMWSAREPCHPWCGPNCICSG